MKKNILVLTLGLIFLAFTQVYAALIWQGDYDDFSYHVGNPENGTFYQISPYRFRDDLSQVQDRSKYGGQNYNSHITLNKYILNNTNNIMRFRAGTKGPSTGISPEGGVEVQGYAMIEFNNFNYTNHGIYAEQKVNSYVSRRFSVDQDGDYYFNASLNGDLVMPDGFNHSGSGGPYYAEYSMIGIASINGFKVSGGTLISIGSVASFEWNGQTGQGQEKTVSFVHELDGLDVIYELGVSLNMSADVCNGMMELITPYPGENFENSMLGNIDNPLMVSASVTNVPIPGALVLFFSGLGGLAVLGRRCKRR